MALKDWKKVSETRYINKKRKGILAIGKSLFTGSPQVNIQIDTIKIDKVEFPQTNIHEEFKTKSKAIAYAKAYMKKH